MPATWPRRDEDARRSPRARLTVGGLMAVVAGAGLVLGTGLASLRTRRWSETCDARAQMHARGERDAEAEERSLREGRPRVLASARAFYEIAEAIRAAEASRPPAEGPLARAATARRLERAAMMVAASDRRVRAHEARIAEASRRAAYHSRLREKYEWAAAYPWLPVSPDPPPPGA